MLQQTQVRTVLPYYARFVARFPTLGALAAADEDDVLALWSGLGYYARGRNLLAAARTALARHGGLPASLDALRALPGFGPYTAGAVASIAFAIPAPAVDGNVQRVLARLFAVKGSAGEAAFRRRIETLAAELVGAAPGSSRRPLPGGRSGLAPSPRPSPPLRGGGGGMLRDAGDDRGGDFDRPGDFNQSLMELGATACTRHAPACSRCPVSSLCAARAAGRAAEIPAPLKRPAPRPLVLACAVARRGGAILLVRRPPGGLFGGLWAPPAVEVAAGADPRASLARALARAHGLRGAVGEELAACERTLTHRALTLRAFLFEPARGPRGAEGPRAAPARGAARQASAGRAERGDPRWVELADLARCGLPAAMRALFARIGRAPGASA
jgi:A/G-specific adenine glycosylase